MSDHRPCNCEQALELIKALEGFVKLIDTTLALRGPRTEGMVKKAKAVLNKWSTDERES